MKKLFSLLLCGLLCTFFLTTTGYAQMRHGSNQIDRPAIIINGPSISGNMEAVSRLQENNSKLPYGPDTLLFENFQSKVIPVTWQNLDIDGLIDVYGRPHNWYITEYLPNPVPADTNWVATSCSWFTPEGQANNWLITPAVIIQNACVLSWKSAPFEGPAYMDGYKVLVSTSDSLLPSFTDTVAVFAESLNGTSTPSAGIVHPDYSATTGLLHQWSINLSAYVGQKIFIAFVHDSDNDNLIQLDDIFVGKPPCTPPVTSFTASIYGLSATFTNTSTSGSNSSYYWDFGDGNVAYTANTSHVYNAAGTYMVCFIVEDSCGYDTVCQPFVVTPCTVPQAGFSFNPSGLTVMFTETSISGGNSSFLWDFGDGNVSPLQNPSYTYASSGSYTVCFIVTDSCDSDTLCQLVTVTSVGVNEIPSDQEVRLFPNPTSDELSVSLHFPAETDAIIKIYTILGKSIREIRFNNIHEETIKIGVREFESGIYFLEVHSGEQMISRRFVIMH